jgi:tetratricopeptide (TPR) repeat protein
MAALALTAVSAHGADDHSYSDMLQRGVSDALRGANERAVAELRIAAFDAIDSIPDYQTAEIYLAVASDRLGHRDDARTAAQKAIQAERVAPTYGTLTVDATIRAAFEKLLPQAVSPERFADVAAFSRLARPASTAPSSGKPTTRRRTTPPQVAPQPVAPRPQPQPAVPAPVQQQTVDATPNPQPAAALPVQQQPATTQPMPKPQPAVTTPPPQPKAPVVTTTAQQPDPVVAAPKPAAIAAFPPQPVAPRPAPTPQPISPLVAAAKHQPSLYTDMNGRIAEAQRLLNEGRMIAARQAFSRIAQTADAPRSAFLDAAKGLSETNAWTDSSLLYAKLFPLGRGEETHYFYEAINRYELGEINKARELLARALPYLPNTREVALYRGKIEGTAQ